MAPVFAFPHPIMRRWVIDGGAYVNAAVSIVGRIDVRLAIGTDEDAGFFPVHIGELAKGRRSPPTLRRKSGNS